MPAGWTAPALCKLLLLTNIFYSFQRLTCSTLVCWTEKCIYTLLNAFYYHFLLAGIASNPFWYTHWMVESTTIAHITVENLCPKENRAHTKEWVENLKHELSKALLLNLHDSAVVHYQLKRESWTHRCEIVSKVRLAHTIMHFQIPVNRQQRSMGLRSYLSLRSKRCIRPPKFTTNETLLAINLTIPTEPCWHIVLNNLQPPHNKMMRAFDMTRWPHLTYS